MLSALPYGIVVLGGFAGEDIIIIPVVAVGKEVHAEGTLVPVASDAPHITPSLKFSDGPYIFYGNRVQHGGVKQG